MKMFELSCKCNNCDVKDVFRIKLAEYGTKESPLYASDFPNLYHSCGIGVVGTTTVLSISGPIEVAKEADLQLTVFTPDFNKALNRLQKSL